MDGTEGLSVVVFCCAPKSPAAGRGPGLGAGEGILSAVWTGLGRGSGIGPGSGTEVESTSDAASVAAAGRMAPVAPSVATSFVARGDGKSWAPFATVGVGELEIAASGGCSTNDHPSGAAFSVCSGSGAFVGAAASGLRKVETFGNSTWYR